MQPLRYESIGHNYARYRVADPRIVQPIVRFLALPPKAVIVDVGAGTGNYSAALAHKGYIITAIEPAATMRHQAKDVPHVTWIAGTAEALPLQDRSADGVICILALHHFKDVVGALAEMRRVCPTGPIVMLTFDPRVAESFWFVDYFPDLWQDAYTTFPPLNEVLVQVEQVAGQSVEVTPFRLPTDLHDKFAAAGWAQPHIYLNPEIRASMSCFALGNQPSIQRGLDRLANDVASGVWHETYQHITKLKDFDAGYRFLCIR